MDHKYFTYIQTVYAKAKENAITLLLHIFCTSVAVYFPVHLSKDFIVGAAMPAGKMLITICRHILSLLQVQLAAEIYMVHGELVLPFEYMF